VSVNAVFYALVLLLLLQHPPSNKLELKLSNLKLMALTAEASKQAREENVHKYKCVVDLSLSFVLLVCHGAMSE